MGKAQANGMSISFGTSSWTADILSYSKDGATADDVETSDLSTGSATGAGRTWEPGFLVDNGTYTFDLHFDTEESQLAVGIEDTITITFPIATSGNTTAMTESFDCYINSASTTGAINELLNGSVTFKVDGDVTVTLESA